VKCPKCGFLGFDSGDRCKNCGYDFSLASGAGSTPVGAHARHPSKTTPGDLPLFRGNVPLPPPRAPLSVRRASPTPPRVRARTPAPTPSATPLLRAAGEDAAKAAPAAQTEAVFPHEANLEEAPAARRAAAAGIDVCLLTLVNLAVVHFTLAVCGLTFADADALPLAPLLAFLLTLNAGYVVLFTGLLGQTLGKMAAGIEVVRERRERMDLQHAAVRAAAMVAALLPAGIGWFAGLVGNRRGLHDRLAGTHVVRVAGA
jgi:uncharacterized RDD family membrane protein YckC